MLRVLMLSPRSPLGIYRRSFLKSLLTQLGRFLRSCGAIALCWMRYPRRRYVESTSSNRSTWRTLLGRCRVFIAGTRRLGSLLRRSRFDESARLTRKSLPTLRGRFRLCD